MFKLERFHYYNVSQKKNLKFSTVIYVQNLKDDQKKSDKTHYNTVKHNQYERPSKAYYFGGQQFLSLIMLQCW